MLVSGEGGVAHKLRQALDGGSLERVDDGREVTPSKICTAALHHSQIQRPTQQSIGDKLIHAEIVVLSKNRLSLSLDHKYPTHSKIKNLIQRSKKIPTASDQKYVSQCMFSSGTECYDISQEHQSQDDDMMMFLMSQEHQFPTPMPNCMNAQC